MSPIERQACVAGSLKEFELLALMAWKGFLFNKKQISFIDLEWNVSVHSCCSLRFLLKDLNNLKVSSSDPTSSAPFSPSPVGFTQTTRPLKAQFCLFRLALTPLPSLLPRFSEYLAISRVSVCIAVNEALSEPFSTLQPVSLPASLYWPSRTI